MDALFRRIIAGTGYRQVPRGRWYTDLAMFAVEGQILIMPLGAAKVNNFEGAPSLTIPSRHQHHILGFQIGMDHIGWCEKKSNEYEK
jgi:hypothetical protein